MSTEPPYWPLYCEENVWQACGLERYVDGWVLIISNSPRAVPLWFQRAGADGHGPVIWDYHVVLASPEPAGWSIIDQDTALGSPVAAAHYLDKTFVGVSALPPEHNPQFRVMSTLDYRATFSSDRRHMLKPDGSYSAPPPPWEPIGAGTASNLLELIDMHRPGPGEILSLSALRARLVDDPSHV